MRGQTYALARHAEYVNRKAEDTAQIKFINRKRSVLGP
jgi:hypothetical protein